MESSLTAALMRYGSDIQLKEKQKEILEYVYQGILNP
jgi:DNA-binding CsgD family transcriptional regulator